MAYESVFYFTLGLVIFLVLEGYFRIERSVRGWERDFLRRVNEDRDQVTADKIRDWSVELVRIQMPRNGYQFLLIGSVILTVLSGIGTFIPGTEQFVITSGQGETFPLLILLLLFSGLFWTMGLVMLLYGWYRLVSKELKGPDDRSETGEEQANRPPP